MLMKNWILFLGNIHLCRKMSKWAVWSDPLCGSAQKGLFWVLETRLETRVMAFWYSKTREIQITNTRPKPRCDRFTFADDSPLDVFWCSSDISDEQCERCCCWSLLVHPWDGGVCLARLLRLVDLHALWAHSSHCYHARLLNLIENTGLSKLSLIRRVSLQLISYLELY